MLGRWTRVDFSGGFGLAESDDPLALAEFALIGCAANIVLQGGVKSADGAAVLVFDVNAGCAAVA